MKWKVKTHCWGFKKTTLSLENGINCNFQKNKIYLCNTALFRINTANIKHTWGLRVSVLGCLTVLPSELSSTKHRWISFNSFRKMILHISSVIPVPPTRLQDLNTPVACSQLAIYPEDCRSSLLSTICITRPLLHKATPRLRLWNHLLNEKESLAAWKATAAVGKGNRKVM